MKKYGDAKPILSAEDQEKKRSVLLRRFLKRFDFIKAGQDHYARNEYPAAIENYRDYLHVLVEWHQVDIKQLTPQKFDKIKDMSELLVISHVFWDLARVYDRVPSLRDEFEHCLNQFVNFSVGMRYHDLNLRTFSKYLRSHQVRNRASWEAAHTKLIIRSKKCYIATHCFGENHPITNELRRVKPILMKYKMGRIFVEKYYQLSPLLIHKLKSNPACDLLISQMLTVPLLSLMAGFTWCFKKRDS